MNKRALVFKILRYTGLPFLIRELVQRRKVSIVMFHDIEPENAAQAFGYLAKRYNIISLDEFLEARKQGALRRLPAKSMILTLDDGHIGNYQLLPVLQELKVPVSIFLCAGIVNTHRHFWFLYKRKEIRKEPLKHIPDEERLEFLKARGFTPEKEFETAQALTKAQIEAMKPWVNFQSHTVFHPCLPQCSDEVAREEIAQSKKILEQDFGLRINAFAFPNGDYSDRDVELLREAGYECAITVDFGYNTLTTDPFRLKRLSIEDYDNIDAVCVKASGIWTLIMHWFKKRRLHGWKAREPLKLNHYSASACIAAVLQNIPEWIPA